MKGTKTTIAYLLIIAVIAFIIIKMATSTTPEGLRQKMFLEKVQNCIWYGYDGIRARIESEGLVSDIVLLESLLDYPPLDLGQIEELDGFGKKCNLYYNPKGYENKTWIIVCYSRDIGTLVGGNLVLWSDKTISRKHGMTKGLENQKDVKYYYFLPPEMMD